MSERIVVVTTCDLCQIEGKDPALVDAWGLVDVPMRGIFAGPEEKAKENGWVEAEYGTICPECANEQASQEQIDALTGVDHGAASQEAMGAILGIGEGSEP